MYTVEEKRGNMRRKGGVPSRNPFPVFPVGRPHCLLAASVAAAALQDIYGHFHLLVEHSGQFLTQFKRLFS